MLPKESIRSDLPTNSKKERTSLPRRDDAVLTGGTLRDRRARRGTFGSNRAHVDLQKLVNDFDILAVVSASRGVEIHRGQNSSVSCLLHLQNINILW